MLQGHALWFEECRGNVPAACEQNVLRPDRKEHEVYVDDMLVKSTESGNHTHDLHKVFETLKQYRIKLNPTKCAFRVSSRKFLGYMVSSRRIEANLEKI